jgi:hypothetical protein
MDCHIALAGMEGDVVLKYGSFVSTEVHFEISLSSKGILL